MIPVPISTPGFDNAPYLTSANWVTKDPETGIYNIGNYRSQIKSPNRTGGLFTRNIWDSTGGSAKPKGIRLEAAIAIGVVPAIAYSATAKTALRFRRIPSSRRTRRRASRGRSMQDRGFAGSRDRGNHHRRNDFHRMVEPEGPFGEYPGYMGHRSVSPFMEVTCITHRRDAIYTALMSQFPPSESSKIKHTGTEKIIYKYLRLDSGNSAVTRRRDP